MIGCGPRRPGPAAARVRSEGAGAPAAEQEAHVARVDDPVGVEVAEHRERRGEPAGQFVRPVQPQRRVVIALIAEILEVRVGEVVELARLRGEIPRPGQVTKQRDLIGRKTVDEVGPPAVLVRIPAREK